MLHFLIYFSDKNEGDEKMINLFDKNDLQKLLLGTWLFIN